MIDEVKEKAIAWASERYYDDTRDYVIAVDAWIAGYKAAKCEEDKDDGR